MQFNQNINWVAAGGAVVTLFAYFFPDIPENVRNAILALALVGVTLLVSIFHTFINHPANVQKAEELARKAVLQARKGGSALALLIALVIVLGGGLSACSLFPKQDPKTILSEVEYGVSLARATYQTICLSGSAPSFCTDPQAQADYAKAQAAIDAAIATTAAAINLSGDVSTPAIVALLQELQNDWQVYNAIVNTVQQKNAKLKGLVYRPIPLR